MSFTRMFLNGILILAALAVLTPPAFAQKTNGTGDKVLVTGRYALKQSDVDSLSDFYEWLLNAEFTAAERREYQAMIVKTAQANERSAQAVGEIVQAFRKSLTADEAKREQIRQQLLPEIIAAMEKENSEINDLLLRVYRKAQGAATSDTRTPDDSQNDEPDTRGGGGAVRVSDLAGIWSTSSVSGARYRSLVTGALSDPSGSIIEYQISPDGAIKHVGYLSSTVYSCTTKLFISRTGRIQINGSQITFDFAAGKRMYQTCSQSASRNDTLPAERKTYPFRLERDEYGVKLCTTEDNGKDFCIRKKGE